MAAPPTVVKSREVAGVVVASVSAAESESTTAVEPAEHALNDAPTTTPSAPIQALIILPTA